MSFDAAHAVARAVLYEGYALYPYRKSSVKNQKRFPFGTLYPPGWTADRDGADPCNMHTEWLVRAADVRATLEVRVRFLQYAASPRTPDARRDEPVTLPTGDWSEAVEREVAIPPCGLDALLANGHVSSFCFDGRARGEVRIEALALATGTAKLEVTVANTSSERVASHDDALSFSLASTHVLARVTGEAEFVSLLDPPADLAAAVAGCTQKGAWPVLIGGRGDRSTMLASPIILYDYPAIAPESAGDLFDATEIDEILTLRILTMTEAEKREARAMDPRTRELLDRVERMDQEALARLHGAIRAPGDNTKFAQVTTLAVGDRVVIRPRARGDVLDIVLAGRRATVVGVERDLEGRRHVAVTIDDDPGADLGAYAHRFFFHPDELERTS